MHWHTVGGGGVSSGFLRRRPLQPAGGRGGTLRCAPTVRILLSRRWRADNVPVLSAVLGDGTPVQAGSVLSAFPNSVTRASQDVRGADPASCGLVLDDMVGPGGALSNWQFVGD